MKHIKTLSAKFMAKVQPELFVLEQLLKDKWVKHCPAFCVKASTDSVKALQKVLQECNSRLQQPVDAIVLVLPLRLQEVDELVKEAAANKAALQQMLSVARSCIVAP